MNPNPAADIGRITDRTLVMEVPALPAPEMEVVDSTPEQTRAELCPFPKGSKERKNWFAKERQRVYYRKHHDEIRNKEKARNASEHTKNWKKEYREKNRDKLLGYTHKYRSKPGNRTKDQAYAKAHREVFNQSKKEFNKKFGCGKTIDLHEVVGMKETPVSDALALKVGGKREQTVREGGKVYRADVVTADKLYEVKRCDYWKRGIKQVLVYAEAAELKPCLHIFGMSHLSIQATRDSLQEEIEAECEKKGIECSFE